MRNIKKMIAVGAMVLALGATSATAFAASTNASPTEAGRPEEFKKEQLEIKRDNLEAQVAADIITQEKADSIIAAIEANKANCDGNGGARIGREMGAKFGSNGEGLGNGASNQGARMGRGQGNAKGMQGIGAQNGAGNDSAN